MKQGLLPRIRTWFLSVLDGFAWATTNRWLVLAGLAVYWALAVLVAWHTEQTVCFVLGLRHTFGLVYLIVGISAVVLLAHEAEHIWKWEWIKLPIGLLCIWFCYYFGLALLWILLGNLLSLSEEIRHHGIILAFALACTVTAVGYGNSRRIRTVSYHICVEGLSGTHTLALISDLHLGPFVHTDHARKIAEQVNAIGAELIVIAGDLIDDDHSLLRDKKQQAQASGFLRKMQAPEGVVLTLGNHDPRRDDQPFRSFLEASGITLLDNAVLELPDYYLVGRTDPTRNSRLSMDALIQKCVLPKPVIVSDHDPRFAEEAAQAGADVILSGHTHAGQFFPANLATRIALGKSCFYGLQKIGTSRILISSGAGCFNMPIRLGTHNEVVKIILDEKPD